MANLTVRSTVLSKYEENYLKRDFQIAELIAEFSVCFAQIRWIDMDVSYC